MSDDIYMLAGYMAGYPWKPPAQSWTKHLPAAVNSVSDCLTDFLPEDQDALVAPWHTTWQDAARVSRQATARAGNTYVLAMSVPESAVPELVSMNDSWTGDYPHPIQVNLAQPVPPPPGTIQGFEVLGFESGRFHSWLCYSLHREAFDMLGIRTNDRGLPAACRTDH